MFAIPNVAAGFSPQVFLGIDVSAKSKMLG
jgi:hypothetical protein